MAFAPESVFENPSEGQHVAVLVDQIDGNWHINATYPKKGPKHMNRLVFCVEETGSKGQPLYIRTDVNLTRSDQGNLLPYVRAFAHPKPIAPADWETANHIGKCVGLNIVHKVKSSGTWANIAAVLPLPKTAQRIDIPNDYIRSRRDIEWAAEGAIGPDSTDTAFPGNQAKSPQSTAQAAKPKGQPVWQEEAQVPLG